MGSYFRDIMQFWITFFSLFTLVFGHGNLVYPPAWWDVDRHGWFWTPTGGDNKLGCGVLDLPQDTEFSNYKNKPPDCMFYWFTNKVEHTGEATLPEYMSQPETECVGQAGHHHDPDRTFPWHAPGTAPVYGSCGTAGGEPFGCDKDGKGEFGECCSHNCDTYAMGKNAEDYPWPDIPTTVWRVGSIQEVAWYCSANHAGGYSYRLCKANHELTEECFQQNQLNFVDDVQWVQYGKDRKTGYRTELDALQTTQGTYPPGSMWRANPLFPHQEEGGSDDYGHGHIIDNVKVPDNMEPGEYTLSLRWDTKCTPQVWTSCAQIVII